MRLYRNQNTMKSIKRVAILKKELLFAELMATNLRQSSYDTRTFDNHEVAIQAFLSWKPDLIFVGHSLYDDHGNSLDLIAVLRDLWPTTPPYFVLFTNNPTVEEGLQIFQADIGGYFSNQDSALDLLICIECIQKEVPYLSPAVQQLFAQQYDATKTQSLFSGRETTVLEMVAAGLSNKEIAQKLFISCDTVKVHRKNIRRKLNLKGGKNVMLYYVNRFAILRGGGSKIQTKQ